MIGTIARGVTGFRPEASPSATPAPRRRASYRRAVALWWPSLPRFPSPVRRSRARPSNTARRPRRWFLQRCEGSSGVDPAGCRRLNERLQSALGYEAYLAHADGGPEAFARQSASRCLVADALRRGEPGCGTRAAALVDR